MNVLLDEDDDHNYNTSVVDHDNDNAEVSQLFSIGEVDNDNSYNKKLQ